MNRSKPCRRTFLASSAAGAIAWSAPSIVTAKKTGQEILLGEGDYQYRVDHAWAKLPDKYSWQTTHNVAVDRADNLYVIHQGSGKLPDHPAIFVFDPEGTFVRAFGNEFQGGGHGIEVRKEGNEEFLYVCAYKGIKALAKLTLTGEIVWLRHAPMDSGVYAKGEDTSRKNHWGRDRFLPTNIAFLDDGDFLLADGYGSYTIHRYDKEGNWKSHWGGPGKGKGKFNTPHGIWTIRRDGEQQLLICDRGHHKLQRLTIDGKHLETLSGFGKPANIDTFGDLKVVSELFARLTLLNERDEIVAHLGEDAKRVTTEKGIRDDRSRWHNGKFVHPHDACFDSQGNLFVAEWVPSGRVSKLTKIG